MASIYVDQSTQTEENYSHDPYTRTTELEPAGQLNSHDAQSGVRNAIVMRLTFAIITMGLLNLALLAGDLLHEADLLLINPSTKILFAVLLGVCTGMGVSCVGLKGKDTKLDQFQGHPRCAPAVLKARDDDKVLMVRSQLGGGVMGHAEGDTEEAEEMKKQGNTVLKKEFQIWDDGAIHGLEWPIGF
ncbi:MAG: hypothetical protein Q9208_008823 [Pyrenodesmia sp. 3 TL-2023]